MPKPPRAPLTPLERFFLGLQEAVEEAAEDLLDGLNQQIQASMQQQQSQINQARAKVRQRVSERRKKTGSGGRVHVPQYDRRITAYDVLEVSPKASPETISAAFRSLSQRYHPDNKKTGNEERFKAISLAWTTLKDPEKRKKYDRSIGVL